MILKTLLFSSSKLISNSTRMSLSLKQVIEQIDYFAPLKYAEKWDNVGLLIEPYTPKDIKVIFLTNDLTEKVLDEALESQADLIISYHPPIFSPIKRINQDSWKERIISICLENRIALYSPHTSWDIVKNGINDWLASIFGTNNEITPIRAIPECPGIGIGRIIDLKQGITIEMAIDTIKDKLNLQHLHVGIGCNSNLDSEIKKIAVCAGSGSSVLKGIKADLYLTGEMSHHEVLDANQNNISVILCNHSNSERGYLSHFRTMLHQLIGQSVNIVVSKVDADPLKTY